MRTGGTKTRKVRDALQAPTDAVWAPHAPNTSQTAPKSPPRVLPVHVLQKHQSSLRNSTPPSPQTPILHLRAALPRPRPPWPRPRRDVRALRPHQRRRVHHHVHTGRSARRHDRQGQNTRRRASTGHIAGSRRLNCPARRQPEASRRQITHHGATPPARVAHIHTRAGRAVVGRRQPRLVAERTPSWPYCRGTSVNGRLSSRARARESACGLSLSGAGDRFCTAINQRDGGGDLGTPAGRSQGGLV